MRNLSGRPAVMILLASLLLVIVNVSTLSFSTTSRCRSSTVQTLSLSSSSHRRRRRRQLFSSSSRTVEEPSSAASSGSGTPSQASNDDRGVYNFTSAPFRVYIEDTDAYGIMYHSNYLRAYERALFLEAQATNRLNEDGTTVVPTFLRNDDGWSIVAVGRQKFVSAPVLGEELAVRGQLVAASSWGDDSPQGSPVSPTNGAGDGGKQAATWGGWSVWNMQVTSPDGGKVYNMATNLVVASPSHLPKSSSSTAGRVGTLATVQQYLPPRSVASDCHGGDLLDAGDVSRPPKPTPRHRDIFPVHRDETDSHAFTQIPLRTILNYFERGRTNSFGGPDNLRRLQEDHGLHAVVTSIRDLSLAWTDRAAEDDPQEWETMVIYPTVASLTGGQTIVVETITTIKRNGMVLEMDHSIKLGGDGDGDNPSSSQIIAQGRVDLIMLDTEKRRPTSNLPSWAQSILSMDVPP